jgi:phosphopantothenoylcysteine decarboxylase/phosphopantothenate--cysteine ligase
MRDLVGVRIVTTAGGTSEPLDPVRVITNRSTGKMGTAMAEAALRRGASVTLISSAPNPTLYGLRFVPMTTIESLRVAVLRECAGADIVVMAAAVSDFRPMVAHPHKIKKKTDGRLTIEFEQVADFLHEIADPVFKVGFAAETQDLVVNATRKFTDHGMHIVCANPVNQPDAGFGADTNRVTMLDLDGTATPLPLLPKSEVAHRILDHVQPRYVRWRRDNPRVGTAWAG